LRLPLPLPDPARGRAAVEREPPDREPLDRVAPERLAADRFLAGCLLVVRWPPDGGLRSLKPSASRAASSYSPRERAPPPLGARVAILANLARTPLPPKYRSLPACRLCYPSLALPRRPTSNPGTGLLRLQLSWYVKPTGQIA